MSEPKSTGQVCFLVDTTLSMQPYVIQVREKIVQIIAMVLKEYPLVEIEVSVVSYKDGAHTPQVVPFTKETQVIETYISKLTYQGGDDFAEDVESGLKAALALDWTAKNRLLFHIADAPSHGAFYKMPEFEAKSNNYDKRPEFDSDGTVLGDLIKAFQTKEIDFIFLNITGATQKMEKHFRTVYNKHRTSRNMPFESAHISRVSDVLLTQCVKFILSSFGTSRVDSEGVVMVPGTGSHISIPSMTTTQRDMMSWISDLSSPTHPGPPSEGAPPVVVPPRTTVTQVSST